MKNAWCIFKNGLSFNLWRIFSSLSFHLCNKIYLLKFDITQGPVASNLNYQWMSLLTHYVLIFHNHVGLALWLACPSLNVVGCEFASRLGHTKDHHKNGTNCLPALHACVRVGVLTVQPNCLKGRVVCGTVYGDIHLKDLIGSIAKVGYCIQVPDFYLVLHGIRWRKSTIKEIKSPPDVLVVFLTASEVWAKERRGLSLL